jgi:hypothetical protein
VSLKHDEHRNRVCSFGARQSSNLELHALFRMPCPYSLPNRPFFIEIRFVCLQFVVERGNLRSDSKNLRTYRAQRTSTNFSIETGLAALGHGNHQILTCRDYFGCSLPTILARNPVCWRTEAETGIVAPSASGRLSRYPWRYVTKL